MSDIKAEYGAANQTITITLADLVSGASGFRQSVFVPNATNVFLDALVGGKITTGATPTVDSLITFYVAGSVDEGTNYSGDAAGTDTAYAGRTENLFFLGSVSVSATANATYQFGPFSVSRAFGGLAIPERWSIVVHNNTGANLHATAGNHAIRYQGVYADVA